MAGRSSEPGLDHQPQRIRIRSEAAPRGAEMLYSGWYINRWKCDDVRWRTCYCSLLSLLLGLSVNLLCPGGPVNRGIAIITQEGPTSSRYESAAVREAGAPILTRAVIPVLGN